MVVGNRTVKNALMFGKVKKWLGIEGVKLELILPEVGDLQEGSISGTIRFYSLHAQTVTAVRVLMIEKFSRGRRNDKLTDEYELGSLVMEREIAIPSQESVELDFDLPFELIKSEMDELEGRNAVLGGWARTAKWIRGVKSEYSILAEAKVRGVALNPFDKQLLVTD